MDELQFYPTGYQLASKAWGKFQNKDIVRVLEPSAGNGDLLKPLLERFDSRYSRRPDIDAIEINMERHPALTAKGINVVGIDFTEYGGIGAGYSHIIMNPPFNVGVQHVLKAWDILFDGELVAILNAESLRNLCTNERRLLASIIEAHGSVEFIEDAFTSPDTLRTTQVEIALIYLKKTSDFMSELIAKDLSDDAMTGAGLATGFTAPNNEIALKKTAIENSVRVFNAAVKAQRDAVFFEARSGYYSSLLGSTLATLNAKDTNQSPAAPKTSQEWVQKELMNRYIELKDRAWTSILRSTDVQSRLSSKAAKKIEAEFESIKKLEFTVKNIYGFILGLIEKQSEINLSMMLDVFDTVTKYHSENRIYYKGWKSNDKHRTQAFKMKANRFIIPGYQNSGWRGQAPWELVRFVEDFDRVFAMLEGKQNAEVSLSSLFSMHYDKLKSGERLSGSYFDVRYYPGAGTIHFFPTRKDLVDRLNRMVGKERGWLPQDERQANSDFIEQYEKAEKLAGKVEAAIKIWSGGGRSWSARDIEWHITRGSPEESKYYIDEFGQIIDSVLADAGYDVQNLLGNAPDDVQKDVGGNQIQLLSAA